ncbi:MAG: zinc-dependent metalloprotease, partial [Myxococcota bacterium]
AIWLTTEVDRCRAEGRADCDAEATRLAQERGLDAALASIAQMEEMVVLCHSPVEAGDHAACGEARLPEGVLASECQAAYDEAAPDRELIDTCRSAINVRRGDLRYHQVNVIEEPQTPSPWGIMVDSIDPITGETIAASINVWSHVNDIFSQGIVDKLRYIEGELSTDDVTNGDFVRDWATAARAASTGGGGALPMLDREALEDRVSEFAGGEAHIDRGNVPREMIAQIRDVNRDLSDVRAALSAPSSNAAVYSARRRQAAGTEFEAELMTPMVQELQGVDGLPLSDSTMDIASPLRGGNPSFQRDLDHLHQEALGRRGACVLHSDEAAAPFSLTGLAKVLQEKFGAFNPEDPPDVQQARAERMRHYVAQRAHFAVMAHEIGHSIGLRHNFVSSSNAWQYRPQYWQLRTKNGEVTQPCNDLAADGESCVGPRYFDPVTQEESDNLIWMWMHSSVMDYAGELTQDMLGLGIYDFAATRMMYGESVAVLNEPGEDVGSPQGQMLVQQQDNFGGILGISYEYNNQDVHYSELQSTVGLIRNCVPVPDPTVYRPSDWDEQTLGAWSPLLDGMMVQVDGAWTRCEQQSVDYVRWDALNPGDGDSGPPTDSSGRVRMPYGFATDRWADLGNLSVYRHDNGADPYEIFNFMITSQEVWHIFDAYRRGRQNFSVRAASDRTLTRFNAKLRDGAKGLGLIKNIYRDFALHQGFDFDTFWPIVAGFFPENILASSVAFDHIARTLSRPEVGPHFRYDWDDVLRSARDVTGAPGETLMTVPTGASGYYGTIGLGGALVENQLCSGCGEFDADFTMNAGSYYDKMNAAMLLTESVDNFISSSRTDFVDPRYRAVSLADLFPEGYRRWLGNNLTGDDFVKGVRVATDAAGRPLLDSEGYPSQPLGWTSWWGDSPQACFPAEGTTLCSSFIGGEAPFDPRAPANTGVIDPQIGWEQQKFLIAWTMLYLPENEEMQWLDQMRLWELGADADPAFARRIELHSPDGKIYVAKTFGTEEVFGQVVQRGIAARVLEYANDLLAEAYETTQGPDLDNDGEPDWVLPVYSDETGLPVVRWDPTVSQIDGGGFIQPGGVPGCNATENTQCTCTANRSCVALRHYLSVPAYLRESLEAYRLGAPDPRGVF